MRRAGSPSIVLFAAALAAVLLPTGLHAEPEPPALVFSRGGTETPVAKSDLRAKCEPGPVEVDDPYYGRTKRFLACPLARVLAIGFGDASGVAGQDVLLRAIDGYTRSVAGDQLLIEGAFLAFEDADREAGGFDEIDRRQVDPAPFYMIWQGEGRNDTAAWPWPYQLRTIEIAPFETRFPHTIPVGAEPASAERRGFALFRRECFSCHSINGEGGKVGPDLNVPQSIVAYRPAGQIRAFIRNPRTFRYTTMPPHLHLGEAELDDLLAYFTAMSQLQHDPGSGGGH